MAERNVAQVRVFEQGKGPVGQPHALSFASPVQESRQVTVPSSMFLAYTGMSARGVEQRDGHGSLPPALQRPKCGLERSRNTWPLLACEEILLESSCASSYTSYSTMREGLLFHFTKQRTENRAFD